MTISHTITRRTTKGMTMATFIITATIMGITTTVT